MKRSLIIIASIATVIAATAQTADDLWVMGYNYQYGEKGCVQNDTLAKKYYIMAAEKGSAEAMLSLYWSGYIDCEESKVYLQSAADMNYFLAYAELSKIYYDNRNMPCMDTNLAKSIQYAKIAAEGGDDEGQRIYGLFHILGVGIPRNDSEGVRWLEASAENDNETAMKDLSALYYNNKDYIKYAFWLKKAAEFGNAEAQLRYSNLIYDNDLGIPKMENEACKWAEMSARQGYEPAYYHVAWYYATGHGGAKQDKEIAIQWCRDGIKKFNNLDCMWLLAETLPQNDVERIIVLEQAANLGHKSALAELAKMNVDNKVPNANKQWGLNMLESLSKEGNPRAMAYYGVLLYDGEKVKGNRKKGIALIDKAANAGDMMGALYKRFMEISSK